MFYFKRILGQRSPLVQDFWRWYDSLNKNANKSGNAIDAFMTLIDQELLNEDEFDDNEDLCSWFNQNLSEITDRYHPEKDDQFKKDLVMALLLKDEPNFRIFFESSYGRSWINWLDISDDIQFEVFNYCLKNKKDISLDNLYYRAEGCLRFLDHMFVDASDMASLSTEDPAFATEAASLIEKAGNYKYQYTRTLGERGWISNTLYLLNNLK